MGRRDRLHREAIAKGSEPTKSDPSWYESMVQCQSCGTVLPIHRINDHQVDIHSGCSVKMVEIGSMRRRK